MHAQDAKIFEQYKRLHAYESALELKAEGRIRRFGISYHDKAAFWTRFLLSVPRWR